VTTLCIEKFQTLSKYSGWYRVWLSEATPLPLNKYLVDVLPKILGDD